VRFENSVLLNETESKSVHCQFDIRKRRQALRKIKEGDDDCGSLYHFTSLLHILFMQWVPSV